MPVQNTLSFASSAVPATLVPVRLSGREGMNSLFLYELLLKTPDDLTLGVSGAMDLVLEDMIGREISCAIELDGSGAFLPGATGASTDHIGAGSRQINALIIKAELWGEEGRHVQYKLTLAPWLHLLTLNRDSRIRQNKTPVDMLDELLARYGFPVEKRLATTYPQRDYQTQYNESDFAFFARITQEWGISYHFEHAEGAHRLVLTDAMGAYKPSVSQAYREVEYHAPGWKTDAEYLHSFVPASHLTSGRYATTDYDYARPRADLAASVSDPRPTGQGDGEIYEFHAGLAGAHYVQPRAGTAGANDPQSEGRALALLRMQALRTHGARASASGNLRGMTPGCTFKLARHPREAANIEYLVLDTRFVVENVAQDSQIKDGSPARKQHWKVEVDFTAHPLSEALRPALTQPKPVTSGPQAALVVGPAGENLWTDDLGRVKVQFPWDRVGQKDQNASCWLRVSSPWAGNQLGGMHLPRIGQEVIVDFLSGDPDLPIVTGRVHNQVNLPPWSLPGQSALSGFRSRELTKDGGNASGGRSNHLILDDTEAGIQAQLKSDHQASQLSLGHITRIEDNAGRKDARGEGFELRTDAHGAIRARQGLLITTEARANAQAHTLDSRETQQRLIEARNLHSAGADEARKNKAQAAEDQTVVAKALEEQNAAIKGNGVADAAAGTFPELSQAHLVLASPDGIQTTSGHSTHIASNEHTAITSGKHTSLSSGDSLLGVALNAIKLFAAQKGIHVVAAQADIEIEALKACIHMLAKDQITIKADRIVIEAKTELTINGGGSYAQFKSGRIQSGTTGMDVRHASSHSMVGPDSKGQPTLPEGRKPGKGQLEITHRYFNGEGLKGAAYEVTDSAGQVKTGKLDANGFAAVSGLAPGGATVKLDKDPRNAWDEASYFGKPSWPPKASAIGEVDAAPTGATGNDMLDSLMKQAGSVASGMAGTAAQTALSSGGNLGKALTGGLLGTAKSMAGGAVSSAISGAVGGAANSALGGSAAPASLPPGISLMHTTV